MGQEVLRDIPVSYQTFKLALARRRARCETEHLTPQRIVPGRLTAERVAVAAAERLEDPRNTKAFARLVDATH